MTAFRILKKSAPQDEARALIHDDLRLLLEQQERWFEKQLYARLLDEGCNLPLSLAKQLFYAHILTKVGRPIPSELKHVDFAAVIRGVVANRTDDGTQLALAVTSAIAEIQQEWQLNDDWFQGDGDHFTLRLEETFRHLLNAAHAETSAAISGASLRHRLYLTWTTALLRTMNARQDFERQFTSIPTLLRAMRRNHAEFCRFMAFCRERQPYFRYIVSRSFWRALETVRLEMSTPHTKESAV